MWISHRPDAFSATVKAFTRTQRHRLQLGKDHAGPQTRFNENILLQKWDVEVVDRCKEREGLAPIKIQ